MSIYKNWTVDRRIDALRETKLKQTIEKQRQTKRDGSLDTDDKGKVPIPDDFRWEHVPNHPNGGYYGLRACGANFRSLLEAHPVYIDPMATLAGGFMFSFANYQYPYPRWNPDYDYSHLKDKQKKYDLVPGIGATQHFNMDVCIGLNLGWKGLLAKLAYYKAENTGAEDFYDAETDVILGMQNWIGRTAAEASAMAEREQDPELKQNLLEMAEINNYIIDNPPRTFREACQWLGWYYMAAVMYNGSGAGGAIDAFLKPYYDRDVAEGILTDEEAVMHLASLLLKDNQYYEVGGQTPEGDDRTNAVSFHMLDAMHRLRIPTAICVRVHEKQDPELMRKSVTYLFEDETGAPSFIGDPAINEGFVRNGYSIEDARVRAKVGCHWCAVPGREYTLNDCVKLSFAKIFEISFYEMLEENPSPTVDDLIKRFDAHLQIAVDTLAEGFDFHCKYMQYSFPELVIDLLCHGPIEKGLDASVPGTLEMYNMCIDATGLGVVADSLAALKQRVEIEKRLTWEDVKAALLANFEGFDQIRAMLKSVPKYGSGGSIADDYAVRLTGMFTEAVKRDTTPGGLNMIPGIFSWANTIPMGKTVGATPNGRKAGEPITHGANPEPGFKDTGALTTMANAVASVQCGWGNTVPIQLEIDPILGKDEGGIEKMVDFLKTYCLDLGGSLVNINILNKERILEAHENPDLHPDLVVRVTGFSAYFASLSKPFRQLVVDRIIKG